MDEIAENEEVMSYRDKLMERAQGKYPDRDFSDDEGLFGALSDDLDDYEGQLSRNKEVDQQLTDRFENDPQFAGMFLSIMSGEGKNPVVSMIETYGDQFRDFLDDPENAEDIAEANATFVERLGKEKELTSTYEANIEKSITVADELQESGGYTDEQITEAFNAILEDANRAILGEITQEMLEVKLKGMSYDEDVDNAANDAEVKGRNEKIELKKKDLKNEVPMIDGNRSAQPKRPKNPTLDSLDEMTGGGSIWDGLKRS